MRKLCQILTLLTAAAAALHAQSYRFGYLWDGENTAILVENGRIKSVAPLGGEAVDLSRYTAVPGLIDAHVHMTFVVPKTIDLLSQAGRSAAFVYLSEDAAKKILETGVTTVRNLNARDYQDIGMRDLINAGLMSGPRMFVSGFGLSPAGTFQTPGRSMARRKS